MLSLGSPKLNLQYESAGILERLLDTIKETLPKEDTTQQTATVTTDNDNKMSAFQVSNACQNSTLFYCKARFSLVINVYNMRTH